MCALSSDATFHIKPEASRFQPLRTLEIELSQPLPTVSAYDAQTGCHYRHARALVRLHTHPLGLIDLALGENGLTADVCADQIWRTLHQSINDHLHQDGRPPVTELKTAGLPCLDEPSCLQERARFLEEAPFVSVVVCTRDRTEELANCLPSLLALRYPKYEIIVIDNAPRTSATADLIRQHYNHLPQVHYVREDRPGLSWARKCGLQHAQGEIVAFTDDDVAADPHWLTDIARGFEASQNVACVTGLHLALELETPAQIWFEQYLGGINKNFSRRIFSLTEYPAATRLYPYTGGIFGGGLNMAFKVEALRAIDEPDPALGSGSPAFSGEDLATFIKVIISGYRIVYEPGAIIYHSHFRDYEALKRKLYNYGVGLTAVLTKCIVDDPKRIFDIGRKLPYALFYALSPKSPKNRKKGPTYPKELSRIELRGMLYGPFAYLHGRWRSHQIAKQFGNSATTGNDVYPEAIR